MTEQEVKNFSKLVKNMTPEELAFSFWDSVRCEDCPIELSGQCPLTKEIHDIDASGEDRDPMTYCADVIKDFIRTGKVIDRRLGTEEELKEGARRK